MPLDLESNRRNHLCIPIITSIELFPLICHCNSMRHHGRCPSYSIRRFYIWPLIAIIPSIIVLTNSTIEIFYEDLFQCQFKADRPALPLTRMQNGGRLIKQNDPGDSKNNCIEMLEPISPDSRILAFIYRIYIWFAQRTFRD